MYEATRALSAIWNSLFGSSSGATMKAFGVIILAIGLALGAYSMTMSVSVDVPAQDFGYGVKTPAMQVANIDRMAQRQNFMIFSGILSVVGAILLGFGAMQPAAKLAASSPPKEDSEVTWKVEGALDPASVSICPKCRHMGSGDAIECGRCGAAIEA
jgi:hypothetical protein